MKLRWLLGALTLAGCASAAPTPAGAVPSPEVIGTAAFGVPSPDDIRGIQAYGFSGNYFYAARPDVHAATVVSPQLESGNNDFSISFRTPFGKTWAVQSVSTTRLSAVTQGREEAFVRDQIRPLVAAWTADGALDTAYGHMTDLAKSRAGLPDPFDPKVVADEEAILKNVGWPLPYRSEAKKEMLLFYASGVVLRVKAAQFSAEEQTVKISRQEAIRALLAVLHDAEAKSVEEQTGRDYFIGAPFGSVFAPTPVGPFADVGPTFSFSDDVGWQASLDTTFAGKATWWINANGWPGYGRGLVDAETGAVIRFTRTSENHGTSLTLPTPFLPPGTTSPTPQALGG